MNNTIKQIIAILLCFSVMFLVNQLTYLNLFYDLFLFRSGVVSRTHAIIQYNVLALFILSVIMAIIYPKLANSNENRIVEGLKFGMMMTILCFLPCQLIIYSIADFLSVKTILLDVIFHFPEQALGGIVIALVYGKLPLSKNKGLYKEFYVD